MQSLVVMQLHRYRDYLLMTWNSWKRSCCRDCWSNIWRKRCASQSYKRDRYN